MPVALSWRSWVGIAPESDTETPYGDTPGSGASAPVYFIPLAGNENVLPVLNRTPNTHVTGATMGPTHYAEQGSYVSGSIPTVLPVGAWTNFLGDLLWNRQTVDGEEYQLKSFTLWICTNPNARYVKKVIGVRCNSWSMDISPETGFITLSIDVIGKSLTYETMTSMPDVPTIINGIYGSSSVVPEYKGKEATLYLNGGVDVRVFALNLSVTHSLVPRQVLDGTGQIRHLWVTSREVTGSLNRDPADTTEFERFLSGEECSLEIVLSRGTNSLTFSLPKVVYEAGGPVAQGDQAAVNVEQYSFRALEDVDTYGMVDSMTVTEVLA